METKRYKIKSSKFPETAYTYYIKQYCRRKGTSETKYQNVLVEATKSWLSLTESEKQQLYAAHKEKGRKLRLHFFDQLKHAEPFLKVKNMASQVSEDLNNSNSAIQTPQEAIEEDRLQKDTNEPVAIDNNEPTSIGCNEELLIDNNNVIHNLQMNEDLEEHGSNQLIRESTNVEEVPSIPLLVEPSPPTIKTSKDLFFMLNSVDGSSTLNWTELTPLQKSQYRSAVCLLKKITSTNIKNIYIV